MSDKPWASNASTPDNEWRRWEMSTFELAPARPQPERTPSKRAEDIAAKIRQAQEAARERARAEGYAAGHDEGLRAGLEQGRETGRAEGYKTGHESGYAAGYEEASQHAARETGRLSALAESCAQAVENLEEDMGQALLSLGIRIAEHVLCTTVQAHPEKILDLVREVVRIDGAHRQATLSLQVNPADLALVRQFLDEEPDAKNWRLDPNEAIAPGGCVVESAYGAIDATLQTRWRRALAALGRDMPLDGQGHEP